MEWTKDDFLITTDKEKIDALYVHQFLSGSYWAEGIPIETVKQSIEGSLCFSVVYLNHQVGFARVITDEATFAYLADVFIDENFREKGLSKWESKVPDITTFFSVSIFLKPNGVRKGTIYWLSSSFKDGKPLLKGVRSNLSALISVVEGKNLFNLLNKVSKARVPYFLRL